MTVVLHTNKITPGKLVLFTYICYRKAISFECCSGGEMSLLGKASRKERRPPTGKADGLHMYKIERESLSWTHGPGRSRMNGRRALAWIKDSGKMNTYKY